MHSTDIVEKTNSNNSFVFPSGPMKRFLIGDVVMNSEERTKDTDRNQLNLKTGRLDGGLGWVGLGWTKLKTELKHMQNGVCFLPRAFRCCLYTRQRSALYQTGAATPRSSMLFLFFPS